MNLFNRFNKKQESCCFCNKIISGPGNNPMPVTDKGKCCDECNKTVVLVERLKLISAYIG